MQGIEREAGDLCVQEQDYHGFVFGEVSTLILQVFQTTITSFERRICSFLFSDVARGFS